MKILKIVVLLLTMIVGVNVDISNANNIQNDIYEMHTKPQSKTHSTKEDMPKEAKEDIDSLKDLKYLKLKTNSKYEIAYAHEDGTYSYISNSNDINEAIELANQNKNNKSNSIPVVINEDGLVVYATEGIGRIVKIKNGQVDTSLSNTVSIYKNKNLSGKEHASINHAFIDDAPIIEDYGNVVKIEVSGYTGYMKKQEADGSINIITVPLNQVKNLSHYNINSQSELVHNISSDITVSNKSNPINLGPAPSFMKKDTKYYSYDGMYFYTDINKLIADTKANTHNNAVNASNPYYNYYLNLPGRSKTSYTASEINKFFSETTSSTSMLRNTGNYFIEAQQKYGVNAMMSIAIAMNESEKGDSDMAKNKFNIFGANANDSYPQGADKFKSIEECILRVSNYSFSNGFMNPKAWKYNNSNLGNKSFGMNVRYAADPYWGEKAANYMHMMDEHLNMKDYNKYTLGIYTNETKVYNKDNKVLYNVLGADSRTGNGQPSWGQVGDTTVVLTKGNEKHEIQPDRGVPVTETNTNGDGTYIWDKTATVESKDIKIINSKSNSMTDYQNHWAKDAIQKFVDEGHINGYADNTFRPNNPITRAEFVTVVNSYFGLTKSSGKVFEDTKNHWAKYAIDVAVTNGICNGKTPTEFKPNDPITREEASVMIASYKNIADRDYDKLNKFDDASKVSSWAKPGVEGSIEKGYMTGYSDNTFRPKNQITRAEAVVTLSRVEK